MAAARADTRTASFIQVGMATTWPHLLPPLAPEEIPASIHYGAAERSNMKKRSGNAASKPAKTSSAEFLNELYKSQQLRERLHTTLAELKETIALLEQGLEEAHRSAHPVRKMEEG